MPAATSALTAALRERGCLVSKREADWNFHFGDRLNLSAAIPWRVVTGEGIAHGDEDDEQWFGLPQPVNGEVRTNELLHGQKVVDVEVERLTADLTITFDGGARLDFFNNSAGYEGWQASIVAGGEEISIIALGGGKLNTD